MFAMLNKKGAAVVTLLLFCSAIFDLALVDVQQFGEISNLSKVLLTLYLCGFMRLSFFDFFV